MNHSPKVKRELNMSNTPTIWFNLASVESRTETPTATTAYKHTCPHLLKSGGLKCFLPLPPMLLSLVEKSPLRSTLSYPWKLKMTLKRKIHTQQKDADLFLRDPTEMPQSLSADFLKVICLLFQTPSNFLPQCF